MIDSDPAVPLERDPLLRRAVEAGASDLILTAGHPPMVAIAGALQPLPASPVLAPADARRLAESFLTPALHERFLRDLELDTRFALPGVAQFRVNLYVQRGHWGAAIRVLPLRVPLPAEIGLAPHVVERILGLTRGLVLVTGPSGAGKSTTIAALIEQLNQAGARRHIVTVEDPIEFVFEPRNAVIDQRQVGTDTRSYALGLRGALRQLPHLLFVGEMRDPESMAIALTAAETGNLVISTLATPSAAATVTRVLDSFPPHRQTQVRGQLAMSLQAVISQVLLPRADGRGRIAAREVMFVTPAVASLIREDKVHQLPNLIATGARDDMVTLDDALVELVERGRVRAGAAAPHLTDPERRARLEGRGRPDSGLPEVAAARRAR